MKKRLLAVLLAAMMMLSFSIKVEAHALDNDNGIIYVIPVNSKSYADTHDISNSVIGYLLEGQIYTLENGDIVLNSTHGVYEVVEQYSVFLTDEEQVNSILSNDSLAPEIRDDIAINSQRAIAADNQNAKVDLYVPSISKYASPDRSRASYESYYKVNNRNAKDTVIYYTNLSSSYIKYGNGVNAGSIANGIAEIIVSGASMINSRVSIYTTGYSVLKSFLNYFGATYYGGNSDYVQFNVFYDKYTKYTYIDFDCDGGWYLGARTEQVKMDRVQYAENIATNLGGKYREYTEYYSRTFTTPNYNNPGPIAYQWVTQGWFEDDLYMNFGNVRFYF